MIRDKKKGKKTLLKSLRPQHVKWWSSCQYNWKDCFTNMAYLEVLFWSLLSQRQRWQHCLHLQSWILTKSKSSGTMSFGLNRTDGICLTIIDSGTFCTSQTQHIRTNTSNQPWSAVVEGWRDDSALISPVHQSIPESNVKASVRQLKLEWHWNIDPEHQ